MAKRLLITAGALLVAGVFAFFIHSSSAAQEPSNTSPTSSQSQSEISGSGSVTSQNQSVLHFQVSGQLVSLPHKEGDTIKKGEVIAGLDSTDAQHTETAAESEYRSAQSALNLVLDNIHLSQYGSGGFSNVGSANETQSQTTTRQEAQETVNQAYDNLQIAKKNLSLYTLTAPFDGILTQTDVSSAGVNVTPTTTFTITDPTQSVFQAQVNPSDIGLIQEGSEATVLLDSNKNFKLTGQVIKIYPDKTITSSGDYYKVDISIPDLLNYAKFGESGTALIQTTNSASITQVPSWTILNSHYIWVMEGNTPKLKQISIGQSRGGMTEVVSGLSKSDTVITDPRSLITKEYRIL